MAREIKFRAWVSKMESMLEEVTVFSEMIGMNDDDFYSYLPEEGKYFYDDYSCSVKRNNGDRDPETMFSPLMGEDWVWIEKPDYELMQYTGLKDKNGKEIYEGDICDLLDSRGFEIVYQQSAFGYITGETKLTDFHHLGGNYHFKWENGQSQKVEIIGNIYENPELLNLKQTTK